MTATILMLATALGTQPPALAPQLHSWRIEAKNATVKTHAEFAGRSPVFAVTHEGAEPGTISFTSDEGLRKVLDSWLPPFVGQRAKRVSFALLPVEATDDFAFEIRASRSQRFKVPAFSALKPKAWNDLSFDIAKPDRLLFALAGAKGRFVFADLKITLDDGRVYDVLNAEAPRYTAMMAEPPRTHAVKPLPKRPEIKFGTSTAWVVRRREDLAALGAFMRKYLPEYDFVLSMAWTPTPALAECMENAPDNIYFQFQGGQHDLRYARLKNALVKLRNGDDQPFMFNSTVATHPVIRDAFEDQAAYLGALGLNSLQQYDYVWFYPKGYSGWDEATITAFREDLTGRDEGLALVDGRTIGFWEWYRDNSDDRPTPADSGVARWDEYVPDVRTPISEGLYLALVHYEWLRQAQRFGRWAKKHCHGGRFDFLLNSEFCPHNGNDHLYLARLRDTGDIFPEFFDSTPRELDRIYRASTFFIRNAKRCGKRWGVTLETSNGGLGSQPYWSTKTGYAVAYLLSALGYDGLEYDGAPAGGTWADYVSGGDNWMLALGMSEARAFRQAKLDGAKKPDATIFHLVARLIQQNGANVFAAFAPGEKGDFRGELDAAQLDFETTVPQDLPHVLGRAKAIFVSPGLNRPSVVEKLRRWRDVKPGERLLVTERGDLAAAIERLRGAAIQDEQGGATAFALPFTCSVGRVAAVFNRTAIEACSEAKYDQWLKTCHAPTQWRQIFDPAKIFYFDEHPGTSATARLRLGGKGPWRVYRFLADREEIVEAEDGVLPLAIGSSFCDIVYFGAADDAAFEANLRRIRADRTLTADFLSPVAKAAIK